MAHYRRVKRLVRRRVYRTYWFRVQFWFEEDGSERFVDKMVNAYSFSEEAARTKVVSRENDARKFRLSHANLVKW